VGSLRDDLPPMDFLIADQFFDRTQRRLASFFVGEKESWAHVGFDKPTCTHLSAHVADACDAAGSEGRIAAGLTYAWKVRNFRPSQNQIPTGRCSLT